MNLSIFVSIVFAFLIIFDFISNNLNNSLIMLKTDQLKLQKSKQFIKERHQSLTNIDLAKLEIN